MKRLVPYIFYFILLVLIGLKVPTWWTHYRMQSKPAPIAQLQRVSGEMIEFPVPGQKMIVVFWATWCGPCKVELNRLNKMMSQGKIKSNQLIAVNIQEDAQTVIRFMNENPFQFLVALDPTGAISSQYNVSGTPTVVFLDEQAQIEWITSGVSPSLEYRIAQFLKN